MKILLVLLCLFFARSEAEISIENKDPNKGKVDLNDNVQIKIMISMKEIILYVAMIAVSCMWCTFLLVYWREIRMVIVRAYKKWKRGQEDKRRLQVAPYVLE